MTINLDTPGWWGGEDRASGRPSLLGLIENGTMDLRTAALLWLLVDCKSSILAAAGPQLAGKTTLLTTLLDLMPPTYRRILTRGRQESMKRDAICLRFSLASVMALSSSVCVMRLEETR